jgi:transcription antitermination factor NusG
MPMNWFALTVKPQHERTVAEQLAGRTIENYAPNYRVKRHWSDRVKIIDRPLFPGYVFCRFRFDDRHKVLSLPSITSVVGFGGRPCPIADEEIDTVRSMVDSGLPILPWQYLAVGQRVRIRHGKLAGLEGILARDKAVDRVVINVEMLGRAVAVEIDRESLTPAGVPSRIAPRQLLTA